MSETKQVDKIIVDPSRFQFTQLGKPVWIPKADTPPSEEDQQDDKEVDLNE